MGNEQSGLPVEVEAACDELVRIPMMGRAESLNLASAASVMIYEAWRAQGFAGADRRSQATCSRFENSARPSMPPCAASIRFSGCGIRPSTFLSRLNTPAMSATEPLGLVPSA